MFKWQNVLKWFVANIPPLAKFIIEHISHLPSWMKVKPDEIKREKIKSILGDMIEEPTVEAPKV
jgi:hypothetical protein